MDTNNQQLLQLGLHANAAFSLATGALLAIAPATVGNWLGVEIDLWLRLLGLALIGHAGILAFVARQPQPESLAKLNLAMIAPYPLMMVALAVFGLVDGGTGQALVLADGAVVGITALVQAAGLRRVQGMTNAQLA